MPKRVNKDEILKRDKEGRVDRSLTMEDSRVFKYQSEEGNPVRLEDSALVIIWDAQGKEYRFHGSPDQFLDLAQQIRDRLLHPSARVQGPPA